jgi:hypothetical protein
MKVVEIEKLTQLDNKYKYKMVVVNTESALDYYQSLDGNAYKFGHWYYIPIGEAKCINDYSRHS